LIPRREVPFAAGVADFVGAGGADLVVVVAAAVPVEEVGGLSGCGRVSASSLDVFLFLTMWASAAFWASFFDGGMTDLGGATIATEIGSSTFTT